MTKKGVVLWHQETIDARDIPLFAEWCEDSGVDSLWFPETWVRGRRHSHRHGGAGGG